MLEYLTIQESVKTALNTYLPGVLATLGAAAGLIVPVPPARHVTYGQGPIEGRSMNPVSIWYALRSVEPKDNPFYVNNTGINSPRALIDLHMFLPAFHGDSEKTEKIVAIYFEAVLRVLENRLRGPAFAVYFVAFDPNPPPISEEAHKGLVREIELTIAVDFEMSRHHLVP